MIVTAYKKIIDACTQFNSILKTHPRCNKIILKTHPLSLVWTLMKSQCLQKIYLYTWLNVIVRGVQRMAKKAYSPTHGPTANPTHIT